MTTASNHHSGNLRRPILLVFPYGLQELQLFEKTVHWDIFLTIQDLFCKDRSQSEVDQDDHAKDDTVISEELEVMFLDISK